MEAVSKELTIVPSNRGPKSQYRGRTLLMTQVDVNYFKKMGLNNPYSKDYIQIIHMDFLSTIDALAETHVANKLAFTLWKMKAEFTENAAFY